MKMLLMFQMLALGVVQQYEQCATDTVSVSVSADISVSANLSVLPI